MSHTATAIERIAYSPDEVALALGVTRAHVLNLIRAGEIPSLKLGRRRLIRRQVLDDLLDELETRDRTAS